MISCGVVRSVLVLLMLFTFSLGATANQLVEEKGIKKVLITKMGKYPFIETSYMPELVLNKYKKIKNSELKSQLAVISAYLKVLIYPDRKELMRLSDERNNAYLSTMPDSEIAKAKVIYPLLTKDKNFYIQHQYHFSNMTCFHVAAINKTTKEQGLRIPLCLIKVGEKWLVTKVKKEISSAMAFDFPIIGSEYDYTTAKPLVKPIDL